jgi:transcription initiation factor TFIID subunit 5
MLWDLGTSKKIATFTGHKKPIWSLDFSAESTLLASGSADETVKIWDCTGQTSAMVVEEPTPDITDQSNGKTET